jgi:hypothetical protein
MTQHPAVGAFVLAGWVATLATACASKGASDAGVTEHVDARATGRPDAREHEVDAGIDVPGFVSTDAGNPIVVDDANCVAPGTASNAVGVGGYCSPNGGQCANAGLDGGVDATAAVCTADFNVPVHTWFCTIACTSTSTCGPGSASCIPSIQGQACIPAACASLLGDVLDAGAADAPLDAPSDAPRSADAG